MIKEDSGRPLRAEPVMNQAQGLGHAVTVSDAETYRGLDCVYDPKPIPNRRFDWLAFDPDGEGEAMAEGATLEELHTDIDRYFEEKDYEN